MHGSSLFQRGTGAPPPVSVSMPMAMAEREGDRIRALRRIVQLEMALQDAHMEIDRLRSRLCERQSGVVAGAGAVVGGGGGGCSPWSGGPCSPLTHDGGWAHDNDLSDIYCYDDNASLGIDTGLPNAASPYASRCGQSRSDQRTSPSTPPCGAGSAGGDWGWSVGPSDAGTNSKKTSSKKKKTKIYNNNQPAVNHAFVSRLAEPRRAAARPGGSAETARAPDGGGGGRRRQPAGTERERERGAGTALHSRSVQERQTANSSFGRRPCAIGSSSTDKGKITLFYS
jgi:hypothetical protein